MAEDIEGRGQNDTLDVLILMGSESDINIMEKAKIPLKTAKLKYEIRVCSAHRMPETLHSIVMDAVSRGVKVIIAGAGMAAHLPGVVASMTTIPVIGVPIAHGPILGGADALYSIVQMPPNIPVACMAINGALNAGVMALQIIDPAAASVYRSALKASMIEKTKKIYF